MKDFILLPYDDLDAYQRFAYREMMVWCNKMDKSPGLWNSISSGIQKKINSIIPNKVHKAITSAVKEIIKALMLGTKFISPAPKQLTHLKHIEDKVGRSIQSHKLTASAEGGLTGAGGFWWSLADFPLLLGIKIKLLQDIASFYGRDGKDPREKVFLLLVLQMAFSSDAVRRTTLEKVIHFEKQKHNIPQDISNIDWHTLQQQYRDYLDIAKLLQMVPLIGAVVGTIANYRLVSLLGRTAMQCYRIRYFQDYGYHHQGESA